MPHVEEVAEGVFRLDTPLEGLSNNYSVFFLPDAKMIIEPGPSAAIPQVLEGMKALGMTRLDQIVPTHIHMDHAGASGSLVEVFQEAKVVVHPRGARHIIDPSRLIQGTRRAHGDHFEKVYGPLLAVPEQNTRVVAEGEVIYSDGRTLKIVYCPGHAPFHIGILDEGTSSFFCGEALGLLSRPHQVVLPAAAAPDFDPEMYLGTMERVKQLAPKLLLYAHGGIGYESQRLITEAQESTRAIGRIVLDSLKRGETLRQTIDLVQQDVADRRGLDQQLDLSMMVGGFAFYYQKRCLLANSKPVG